MRWFATILIGASAASVAFVLFAPTAISPANLLGRVIGFSVTPFLIGLVLSWLFGKLRPGTDGAMHRRMNWIALSIAVLSILGNVARMAP